MANLALKGYCLPKIGQLVIKTHSIVQYIVNKFKFTGSIKNEPRKSKRRNLVLEKKGMYLIKYEKECPKTASNCWKYYKENYV